MPIEADGQTYYTTSEACKKAGIGKSTFVRWVSAGIIEDVTHADRRGWRLFTEEDISRIKAEATRIGRFVLTDNIS
jgi:excisionase family DNA binding protein